MNNNPKICIISLAINGLYGDIYDKKGNKKEYKTYFNKAISHFKQKINELNFKGDLLIWDKELPVGCPSFRESPFAFKVFCFQEAKKQGYDVILWMDSVIYPKSSFWLNLVFALIRQNGYFFVNDFTYIGNWCSDYTLEKLKVNREEIMEVKGVRAIVLGLDFKNKKSNLFFKEWLKCACDKVSFAGKKGVPYYYLNNMNKIFSKDPRVKGHRHDQTVVSIIAWEMNMDKRYEIKDFFHINRNLKYKGKIN